MTGQTAKVVPADKKLYALRDVTGTVESIPLITASILSKKVAEGAQSLVFDVKTGSGAFMKSLDEARSLTRSLVDTGSSLGKRIVGVMTDMSQPLGNMVGNFFEVEESLECLEGNGPADLMELSYRLTAWMLVASGLRPDLDAALESCREGIASGKALGLFLDNVKRQGGDVRGMMDLRGRHRSAFSLGIAAASEGYIQSIDAFAIGLAGISLGVGRNTTSDPVYPDVGFIFEKKAGDRVTQGQKILTMYGKDESSLSAVRADVERSIRIGLDPPPCRSLILEEMQSS
jgi:pyrimidine-nucleoside phosphorylase